RSLPLSEWQRFSSQGHHAYELQEKDLGRLHRAAAHGDLAWLRRWRWWLKRVGIDKTPLHLACVNGHADVVRYLVQKNCQLNFADSFKRSPLMKAVQCQQEECVAILLEHGADPNLADADGNTALHLAVLCQTCLCFSKWNYLSFQDGYTPLNLAISRHEEEMVEFLLTKGADRHAQDQRFRTALTVAIFAGDMNTIQILLWHGGDILITLASWVWIMLTCLNTLGKLMVYIVIKRGRVIRVSVLIYEPFS
uniref:Uncharacterized protein n=1 Tax=Strigops habroptila TaxID=2489341 RepID=A0A672U6X3_STRHB